MVLHFALWAPLVLLAVMILVPVHAVDTTTRVGVFLAGMFAEMDVHETMPALSWASVAIRLGLTTVGDLLDALGRAGSEWADFTSEATLLSAGVPLAAAATVNVVLLLKLRALSNNPVPVVTNPNPNPNSNPFLVNDTAAPEPAPAAKRARTAHRVTRDEVLPKELTDLAAVLARLRMTIAEYEFCMRKQQAGAGGFTRACHWKARRITWKYWNYCELVHLRQLEAIATLLLERDGEFVQMTELFLVAWRIDTQGAHVRTRSGQTYSDLFAPWVRRNLGPAVQDYLHRKGVAGHHHGERYFYMCPTTTTSARNLKASYSALVAHAEANTIESRLRTLPVKDYMALLPNQATQRVMRSLLASVCESKTFLKSTFGFNPSSLERAKSKVGLALGLSAKFELMATVRSDLTVNGQHTTFLKSVKEMRFKALADEHAGGKTPIAERCAAAGVDLPKLIEECAGELGQFDYDHCEEAVLSGKGLDGSAPLAVGRDRGSRNTSTQTLRSENATWENVTRLVNAKLSKVPVTPKLQPTLTLTLTLTKWRQP